MTNTDLDDLVRRAKENPVALAQLASTLRAAGQSTTALAIAAQAVTLDTHDPHVAAIAREIRTHDVPAWHQTILNDQARNAAYEAAIARAVRPGMRVLDIGTGSGLLAMMAARAGGEVIAVESHALLAKLASRIVAANGYADRVRIISRHSSDLDAADIGGRVDVLVSEIISNNVVGQAVLEVHEQAYRRLLKPGATVIPASATVRVALAECHDPQRAPIGGVAGFDLSAIMEIVPPTHRIRDGAAGLRLRSAPADLFTFDLASGGPFRQSATEVAAHSSGTANGVAQWIQITLDGDARYENHPEDPTPSCWAVNFYPDATLERSPAKNIRIGGAHDRRSLRIWADTR